MKVLTFVLFSLLSQLSFGQYIHKGKIMEESLPQAITDEFKNAHPDASTTEWVVSHLSYWYNDYLEGWYIDWYNDRPEVTYNFEKANFYQVTFTNTKGEINKALYTRYGFWHETRTQLDDLPSEVKKGLSKTIYADWKRLSHLEKIEAVGWPGVVYRIAVSKEKRKHIVRLDSEGKIVQVKKLTFS